MKAIIGIILSLLLAIPGQAHAERTRDIVIRDFNKGVSRLDLNEDQKKKWDAVISTIFHLHEKLGGYGKYAQAGAPWIQYPGHWYVIQHKDEAASVLVDKHVGIQVEDYRRVIKSHIEIHDRIEEFDDSLDPDTRKRFRSYFRDVWAWVYDKMTDQLDNSLSKEIGDLKSYTNSLSLTKEQKVAINLHTAAVDSARQATYDTKSQGRRDLWKVMGSPEIPWSKSPMMCKSYFESYSKTMRAYADAVKNIEAELTTEQRVAFQKAVVNKYQKEFESMANTSIK